jgi:tetratricopeptide (TPR) repeat protein
MESGQYGQAALACGAAVSADSGSLQARELLAVALVRQGRAEEAVPHYVWVCDRAGDAAACVALGDLYISLGRSEDAFRAYLEAVDRQPDSGEAYGRLAMRYAELRDYPRAVEALTRAAALMPDSAPAHYALATVYQRQGRYEEAAAAFQAAIAADSSLADAYCQLAQLYGERGDLQAAEAQLRTAVSRRPEHAGIHSMLGDILQRLGRLDEAEVVLQEAVALDPFDAQAHYRLGRVQMIQGKADDASRSLATFDRIQAVEKQILHYRYAVVLNPYDANAHYSLGVIYGQLGDLAAATEEYSKALAIDPGHVSSRINVANILLRQERPREAVHHLEVAIAEAPGNGSAHNSLGFAYMMLGDVPRAIAAFQRAVALSSSDRADIHYNLARLYRHQGMHDQAEAEMAAFRKAGGSLSPGPQRTPTTGASRRC